MATIIEGSCVLLLPLSLAILVHFLVQSFRKKRCRENCETCGRKNRKMDECSP